ncbi:LysR family transcriptional regulator [Shewanella sp. JM162201]|uniref:LysR family transcriptional regulator n=1 Tax=Shewanella jiangmenensis TaxID=2837387 RepID=A0ABS5V424_9GAMM|nr:LysR family transcriptional regulator [Shewanella jiangmenensis]MBT1444566.1 LysR family transcriptional regulator [Shewanella jiangmenensis]
MGQFSKLDLNLLRVFLCVYQQQSFSRAADMLGLTQSSVSNAVQRLKSQIGEELFVRAGRGITPTAAAHQLYRGLSHAMDDISASLDAFNQFDPHTSTRQFTVYTYEAASHTLQPALAPLLSGLALGIVFKDMTSHPEHVYQALYSGSADMVIDILPPAGNNLKSQLLIEEQFVCVAAKDHPRLNGSLSTEQFAAERHCILNLNRRGLSLGEIFCEEPLPERRIYCENSSEISMMASISRSDAIGIAPLRLAQSFAPMLQLQLLPFPFKSRPIPVYMVWPRRLDNQPAHRWLRDTLKHAVSALKP